jgi:primosomal protein N' (replication factor Y) (superfamily II helicase)
MSITAICVHFNAFYVVFRLASILCFVIVFLVSSILRFMFYFNVSLASPLFHGKDGLTYSSKKDFKIGSIVNVPFRNHTVLGFINKRLDKTPKFKTKTISSDLGDMMLPKELVSLLDWMVLYYPAPAGLLAQLVLPSGIIKVPTTDKSSPLQLKQSNKLPVMTNQQKNNLTKILSEDSSHVLLHGDTGSGKTRIYLELAIKTLNDKRSVLILTPEIGLTTPLVNFFCLHSRAPVYALHSGMTVASKRKVWLDIAKSEVPIVVIGPRSALYSPVKNIGLIVLDEAHDSSYKQSNAPRYQTSRIAAKLASLHKARYILGSATPLISDYFLYESKGLPILRMDKPAKNTAQPPEVKLIDYSDKKLFSRSRYLSVPLIEGISRSLQHNEQSLIYLNRRGTATNALCQRCGWHAVCPNCDLSLTYHGDSHSLRCHTCGLTNTVPNACPDCRNPDIEYKGVGTKAIVGELERLFPSAKIQRFDSDVTKKFKLENQHQQIESGAVDILVGTQLLGKGLDLPLLSFVGVVQADTGLLIPDFMASETTFQQLTQIIGRTGRGHRPGRVVIQAFDVTNPTLMLAIKNDYQSFYQSELEERKQFMYPPYCYLLKLQCARSTAKKAEQASIELINILKQMNLPISVLGPAPAFHEKTAKKYIWQLILKSKSRTTLVKIVNELPSGWMHDLDPNNLL